MGLKKNLIKNGFASVLQKVIGSLQQLFLVPFFISAWGVEYYGEWLTLTIIPSVLMFANMGFGTAAGNIIVLRYAAGKKQDAADMAKSGFFIITVIVFVAILISIITILILNFFEVFDKSIIEPNDAILAIILMMIARLLNFFYQFYESYFRAAQRAALSMQIMNVYLSINLIGGVLVLTLGGNIVAFATFTLISTLIFNPIYALIGRSVLKLRELSTAKIIKRDITEAYKIGIGYLLNPLWQSIYFQGTTFVVRILLGPGAVAIFNTVRTLSRSINQLYSIINTSIFPELQFMIGKGNFNQARQLFRVSIILTFFTSLLGMLFLFYFGLWFYEVWTKNELNPPEAMWNIFVLSIGFNALWWTSGVVFQSFNKPYSIGIAGIVAAVLSVILTYVFTNIWGLVGAALGALTLDLVLAIYVLPTACKLIGQPLNKFIYQLVYEDISKIKQIIVRKK
jgi:O-antigen/teichoic acid export membrane protein